MRLHLNPENVGNKWAASPGKREVLIDSFRTFSRDCRTGRGDSPDSQAGAGSRQPAGNASEGFASFAARISQLTACAGKAGRHCGATGRGIARGREWFDLLQRKLLPQLEGPPLLIVAIVGGTNIGKSVVFNHLAGETASAATPLAAGTKHPVCLVPPGCADPQLVGRLFEHFQLHAWQSADDPLGDAAADRIYWRVGRRVPPRLVLVDAPDVDSDVTVNWQRARAIRQTADVLIALLTQQKYNDAAVKQFFRAAVEADKPIIVIFNFCDLEADRDYWPQWLARFRGETGADPELVYVVPYDRAAAEALAAAFYRLGPRHPCSRRPTPLRPSPTDLRNELAALHFDAIKIRTFRGACGRVLDPAEGLPAYLGEIRAAAGQFAAAAAALSATRDGPGRLAQPAHRASWSRKSSSGGTPIAATGRGGSMVSIAWSAGASCGRSARPGPQWPAAAKIRWPPSIDRSRRPWSRRWKNSSTNSRGFRRLATRFCSRGCSGSWAARPARSCSPASRRPIDRSRRSMRTIAPCSRRSWMPGRPAIRGSCAGCGRSTRRWRSPGPRSPSRSSSAAECWPAIWWARRPCMPSGTWPGRSPPTRPSPPASPRPWSRTTGEGARQAAARLFRRLQTRFAQKRAQWLADFVEEQLLGDLLAELRQGAAMPESTEFTKWQAGGGGNCKPCVEPGQLRWPTPRKQRSRFRAGFATAVNSADNSSF